MFSIIIDENFNSSVLTETETNSFIPMVMGNHSYYAFLEQLIEDGDSIFDGDLPENIITDKESVLFDQQAHAYRVAKARLEQYELSVGQAEVVETIELLEQEQDPDTGEWSHKTEEVVVKKAIDPLPAEVEITETDMAGNTTTSTVPNPLIVKDEEERTAAQAVVDATPQAVKEHVDNE